MKQFGLSGLSTKLSTFFSRNKFASIFVLAVTLLPTVVVFQNCGKGFQATNIGSQQSGSLASLTPPTMTLLMAPTTWTNSNLPQVQFSASTTAPTTVAGYFCQIDSGAAISCSSPYTPASALTDGLHTLAIVATDSNGQKSQPLTVQLEIDTVAPSVNFLNSSTAFTTNAPQILFSAVDSSSGSGVASVTCALDSGVAAPCTTSSSFVLPTTSDGAHSVTVVATDRAGNSSTGQLSFNITTTAPTAPTVAIAVTNGQYFNTATPTITFSASDTTGIKTTQCKVDSGPLGNCTSASTFGLPTTADGQHTITVVATNSNNVMTTQVSSPFVIDTVKPVIVFQNNSSTFTTSTPQIIFSITEAGSGLKSVTCAQTPVGATTGNCTSSLYTMPASANGAYTIQITATDNAGHVATSSYAITINLAAPTGPAVAINLTAGAYFKTSAPTINFSVADSAGIKATQCRVDAGALANCTTATSFTLPTTSDGAHTITVIATNNNNVSTSQQSNVFNIDTLAPVITFPTVSSSTVFTTKTPIIIFNIAESGSGLNAATVMCSVDLANPVPCGSTTSYTLPTAIDGKHTLNVTATDNAGNIGTGGVTFSIVTSGPSIRFDLITGQYFKISNPTISITTATSSSATITSAQCQLDASNAVPCSPVMTIGGTVAPSSNSTWAFTLPSGTLDGVHTITVTATDSLGLKATVQSSTFTIDTVAPTVTISAQPYYTSSTPSILFSTSDGSGSGVASVICKFDVATTVPCTLSPSAITLPSTIDGGPHTVTVLVTDKAGNLGTATSSNFIIDTTPPVISAVAGPASCVSGSCTNQVTFTVLDGAGSGVGAVDCAVNGGAPTACTSPFTIPASDLTVVGSQPTTVTVKIYAFDKVLNASTNSWIFSIAPQSMILGLNNLQLLAGSIGGPGSVDGTGTSARFNEPSGIAFDNLGNVYVADQLNNTIRKISAAGVVTTFAGSPGTSGSTDGKGNVARFKHPVGLAVDNSGNVFVADGGNFTIRRITPEGEVTTLAGTAGVLGSADGTGAAASFRYPSGIAVDSAGNIFVADQNNSVIRKVTALGVVSTFAGLAGTTGSADGPANVARFNYPRGVVVDSSGNLFVADTGSNTIRKITPQGVVTTIAGTAGVKGPADGTGAAASFNDPTGISVDSGGDIYVADELSNTIRKITAQGVVTTLAGLAGAVGSVDGAANAARFYDPFGVVTDSAGNLFVTDVMNNAIRKVTAQGVVTTFAGLASVYGSTDGTGSAASFSNPDGVAVDNLGNVYVAGNSDSTIRKITPQGVVTTLAGMPGVQGSTDGTGSAARFSFPYGIAVDGTGMVYVADYSNFTIRKITPQGVVTTLAGQAGSAGAIDSTGTHARFFGPGALAVDSSGNVYVSDAFAIRKINPQGFVTTLAGSTAAGSADGTGTAASFGQPEGIAVDSMGNVFVADVGNNNIRKITAQGMVTTLAGQAGVKGSADGVGTVATFNQPWGLALDSAGNIYVGDTNNNTIRKITPQGLVTTIIGKANSMGIMLGPLPASITGPYGLAIFGSTMYFSSQNAILMAVP